MCWSALTCVHNCIISNNAAIFLNHTLLERCYSEGKIRLLGGQNNTEGTIELCLDGAWGSVCDRYWGPKDAEVVCRQLGFATQGSFLKTVKNIGLYKHSCACKLYSCHQVSILIHVVSIIDLPYS